MKQIEKRYLAVLEKHDWAVSSYTDDGRVELEKYSPAGEDFSICVGVENLPAEVREYAAGFDIDEHIEMWIEARRNGTSGVPSTRELVCAAGHYLEQTERHAGECERPLHQEP